LNVNMGRSVIVGVDDHAQAENRQYSWHFSRNLNGLGFFVIVRKTL
jgi:hypothetical protein